MSNRVILEVIDISPEYEYKNVCRKCGSEDSLEPWWIGRRRLYRCEACEQFSRGVTRETYERLSNKDTTKRAEALGVM